MDAVFLRLNVIRHRIAGRPAVHPRRGAWDQPLQRLRRGTYRGWCPRGGAGTRRARPCMHGVVTVVCRKYGGGALGVWPSGETWSSRKLVETAASRA